MNNNFRIYENHDDSQIYVQNNQKHEGKAYSYAAKDITHIAKDITQLNSLIQSPSDRYLEQAYSSNNVYNSISFAKFDEYSEKDLKPAKKAPNFTSINRVEQFLALPGEHCTNPLPLHKNQAESKITDSHLTSVQVQLSEGNVKQLTEGVEEEEDPFLEEFDILAEDKAQVSEIEEKTIAVNIR